MPEDVQVVTDRKRLFTVLQLLVRIYYHFVRISNEPDRTTKKDLRAHRLFNSEISLVTKKLHSATYVQIQNTNKMSN